MILLLLWIDAKTGSSRGVLSTKEKGPIVTRRNGMTQRFKGAQTPIVAEELTVLRKVFDCEVICFVRLHQSFDDNLQLTHPR